VSPRTLRVVTTLVVVAFTGSALTVGLNRASAGPAVVGAILALGAPVVIVRRVRDHARIDLNTVAASLCVYLLAGMFFAYLYRFLDAVDGPFFTQTADPHSADFVYFSFTTLTTLGYGDFSARGDLGRMLSVAEALLGQLYLVSVVALLVGHFGRERSGSDPDPVDGPVDGQMDGAVDRGGAGPVEGEP
jgi:hypothetical protein